MITETQEQLVTRLVDELEDDISNRQGYDTLWASQPQSSTEAIRRFWADSIRMAIEAAPLTVSV